MVIASLRDFFGLILVVFILFCTSCAPAFCADKYIGPKIYFAPLHRPERIIDFPRDYSLGLLTLVPLSGVRGRLFNLSARGRVVIPAGYCSFFQATQHFFVHPEICATLPADSFDCIQLSSISLSDSEDDEVDRALSHIGHLKGLLQVVLDRSDATDAGIAHLAELPQVQYISLFGNPCTGSCLKQLATIKTLRILKLSGVAVQPQYLKYLSEMRGLENLALSRCQLKDSDLQFLLKNIKLASLDLTANPKLTDACLQYMVKCKPLWILLVPETQITAHGLLSLKGLPLLDVLYTARPGDAAASAALKKLFPRVRVVQSQNKKNVDEDTRAIYAPLH